MPRDPLAQLESLASPALLALWRGTVVIGCALALILAGKPLPF